MLRRAVTDTLPVPPLRLGHGVAFALPAFSKLLTAAVSTDLSTPQDLVKKALEQLRTHAIPFEINLTSNEYLLPFDNVHAQQDLLRPLNMLRGLHLRCVVCTDNDGIWPTEAQYANFMLSSVAGTFFICICSLAVNHAFSHR